jgi:signal transduction histidine kinase
VLRVVLLVNAVALYVYRAGNVDHPAAGVGCVLVMVVWTVVAIAAYADPGRRTPALLGTDLAVAVALVLVSPLVKGPDLQATIPGFWVTGALVAWSIRWDWRGGLVSALALTAADLSVRQDVDQGNYGNIFLLLIGGLVVGFLSESLRLMERERDAAQREAIVGEERARLARAVHDGVLQVLALVQRRGREPGGDAELGRLAGEQEAALRSMIRQQDVVTSVGADHDLAAALEALGRAVSVPTTVSTPGTAVVLPSTVVTELVSAVKACLDNVGLHAGPQAQAWVLLEDEGDRVLVTVRDDGPGIPAHRRAQAEAQGRLGVSQSIVGRLADLGGTAELDTGDFGTEWELAVPRRP